MDKLKRIKITETHEADKVLRPCKLSLLIKQLQKHAEKYGDPEIAFTDDKSDLGHCSITLNMQWSTRRWETSEETADRAERLRMEAKIEADFGSQQALVASIRDKGPVAVTPRPSDFGAEVNMMVLEKKLIPITQYRRCGIPEDVIKLVAQETAGGLPTGIGKDEKLGWFVLQTSGQGPYLIWSENGAK